MGLGNENNWDWATSTTGTGATSTTGTGSTSTTGTGQRVQLGLGNEYDCDYLTADRWTTSLAGLPLAAYISLVPSDPYHSGGKKSALGRYRAISS